MRAKIIERIKKSIAFVVLIIMISVVATIVIKYQVDGETNMPFELKKITIISTAEPEVITENAKISENTEETTEPEIVEEKTTWNFKIHQINDMYFFIDKNENYKKEKKIDSVTIENLQITREPTKGIVKFYMPNSAEGDTFKFDDTFLISDKLTYNGAAASNEKNLEICNQGGKFIIRVANTDVAVYKSNEAEEIKHDGTLIAKTDVTSEEITFEISFDIIIKIGDTTYKATVNFELPYGNILEEGMNSIEITELKDIVFKRIK